MSKALEFDFLGRRFKNPIVSASGTFNNGEHHSKFYDVHKLGAITTKGSSSQPQKGNPQPRMFETASGVMNCIGLQNPGMKNFDKKVDFLTELNSDTPVILNVYGKTVDGYLEAVEMANEYEFFSAYEINISCPNVDFGGACLGLEARSAGEITKKIKAIAKKPIMIKLSPQARSISEVAKACEDGGADAISLINTISAMAINVHTRKSRLSKNTAGLSGPAIHPIAVRMVHEAAQAVAIPILGMGGVYTWEDAAEFILAGASAVGVGTLNLTDPSKILDIIDGLEEWVSEQGVHSISDLVGAYIEC